MVGLDLAKPELPVVAYNGEFKEITRRTLRRHQVLDFFSRLPPCKVGMGETCLGAHYWGRQLHEMGHEVRLVPTQDIESRVDDHKRGFFSDARAIASTLAEVSTLATRVRSAEQQEIHAVRQMHSQCMKDRTRLCNLTWSLLTDCGLNLPKGVAAMRRHVPNIIEDQQNGLSDQFRRVLSHRYGQLLELDAHLAYFDKELLTFSRKEKGSYEGSAASSNLDQLVFQ
jgi:transposase